MNLAEQIRAAQIEAGEAVVIADLARRGLTEDPHGVGQLTPQQMRCRLVRVLAMLEAYRLHGAAFPTYRELINALTTDPEAACKTTL